MEGGKGGDEPLVESAALLVRNQLAMAFLLVPRKPVTPDLERAEVELVEEVAKLTGVATLAVAALAVFKTQLPLTGR